MTRTIARGELKQHCPNIDHCDLRRRVISRNLFSRAYYSKRKRRRKEGRKAILTGRWISPSKWRRWRISWEPRWTGRSCSRAFRTASGCWACRCNWRWRSRSTPWRPRCWGSLGSSWWRCASACAPTRSISLSGCRRSPPWSCRRTGGSRSSAATTGARIDSAAPDQCSWCRCDRCHCHTTASLSRSIDETWNCTSSSRRGSASRISRFSYGRLTLSYGRARDRRCFLDPALRLLFNRAASVAILRLRVSFLSLALKRGELSPGARNLHSLVYGSAILFPSARCASESLITGF